MTKYFPSAKSKILGTVMWGIVLVVFGICIFFLVKYFDLAGLLIISLIFILLFLFIGVIWFRTGYYISNGYLIIKIGPITYSKIMISNIRRLSRSHSILSSPALSLKRLSVKYGRNGIVLISPKNEAEFISLLINENSRITVKI